jgi:hypothetical protein
MLAICVRCGGRKPDYNSTCPACGFRPEGDGLLVSWLLSTHHRDAASLADVAERIQAGETVRPSSRMLAEAKRALGRSWASDPGLDMRQRLALLATSILLTPLVGLTLSVWWYGTRPRAALQALALSLPASLIFLALGILLRFA